MRTHGKGKGPCPTKPQLHTCNGGQTLSSVNLDDLTAANEIIGVSLRQSAAHSLLAAALFARRSPVFLIARKGSFLRIGASQGILT